MKSLHRALLTGLFLAAVSAQAVEKLPPGVKRGPSLEGFSEYSLPNGLKAVLIPDPSKQTLTVNVTYLVGSRHESYGETGMAHLLEHLLFKGTPKHPNIPKELSERGARPNGTTWFDRTNYYETLPATDENLRWAIAFEADRMVHSYIAQKDLTTEMTVVRNEFESGENNPARMVSQRLMSAAYLWHNYGHSTIGARADIENVPITRLQDFYRRYYQPDNAVVVVTGRFDPAKALALIAREFGPIPRSKYRLYPTYTRDPVQDGEREIQLRRVGDVQIQSFAYHVPAAAHADSAPLEVLEIALGDTPSGRLHKALVEKRLATQVNAGHYSLAEPGLFTLTAELRPEMDLGKARAAMLDVIEGVATRPIQASEVARARAKIIKGFDLMLSDPERLGIALSEAIAKGDWRLFLLYRDRIRQVTAEDVQRVATAYFKPANRTSAVFLPTPKPERAEIPEAEPVAKVLQDFKGEAGLAAGEEFDPSPAHIEKRTQRATLAKDLRLLMLPKKTRGGTVEGRMNFYFGTVDSLRGKAMISLMTSPLLMRGTQRKSREEIADLLDTLRSSLSISGTGATLNVSFQSRRETLPELLNLIGEILREPAFPSEEFEQLKQQQLSQLEQQRAEPAPLASIALSRHFNPYEKGDIRYTSTLDERLDALRATSLADVKGFYKQFYSAAHGDLALVGDFDAAVIEPQLRKLLGEWQSAEPYARVPTLNATKAPADETIRTPDKANAIYLFGQAMEMTDEDPDFPALTMANYLIGGGFLNSRLAVRVRQKEGLSYGIASLFTADHFDPKALFYGQAIYAPKNLARLDTAIREEIRRVAEKGVTEAELRAGRDGYLQARQLARSQDATLAMALVVYSYEGRNYLWVEAFEKKVRALTAGAINDVLKRRIRPDQLSVFKAGDFSAKP